MYHYFEFVKDLAEHISGVDGAFDEVGRIERLEMKEWIPGKHRIQFIGKTTDGEEFELTLEVSECQKSE